MTVGRGLQEERLPRLSVALQHTLLPHTHASRREVYRLWPTGSMAYMLYGIAELLTLAGTVFWCFVRTMPSCGKVTGAAPDKLV